jgi:3-hydroxyacyl-CoA dehydrogenase
MTINDIKKIAVLGAGTMGPGIAQCYAIGGYDVTMWTRSESTREKAKATLYTGLKTFAEEDMIKKET